MLQDLPGKLPYAEIGKLVFRQDAGVEIFELEKDFFNMSFSSSLAAEVKTSNTSASLQEQKPYGYSAVQVSSSKPEDKSG